VHGDVVLTYLSSKLRAGWYKHHNVMWRWRCIVIRMKCGYRELRHWLCSFTNCYTSCTHIRVELNCHITTKSVRRIFISLAI